MQSSPAYVSVRGEAIVYDAFDAGYTRVSDNSVILYGNVDPSRFATSKEMRSMSSPVKVLFRRRVETRNVGDEVDRNFGRWCRDGGDLAIPASKCLIDAETLDVELEHRVRGDTSLAFRSVTHVGRDG